MKDAAATAIVARGLVDPRFLETLQGNRIRGIRLSAAHRAAACSLDAKRLALFAGFITMVRHNNDLFDHFPGTLRVLRHYGVELSIFRDHFLSQHPPSKEKETKIANALETFSELSKSRRGRALTGFRDVLLHEHCQWTIRQGLSRPSPLNALYSMQFAADAVPFLCEPAQVIRVTRPPWAILRALLQRKAVQSMRAQVQWLLYYGDRGTRAVRVSRIPKQVAQLVQSIDGHSTCAQIAATLRRKRFTMPPHVRGMLEGLCNAGIIVYLIGDGDSP
jgi:hypothetical protein